MKKRPLIDCGDGTHLVPLTQGRFALIDSADAEHIGKHNWLAHLSGGHWYGRRRDGRTLVLMHRQILAVGPMLLVDHRNGCTLDNRRSNLRPATNAQNVRNSRTPVSSRTGLKGINYVASVGRWRARIRADGKQVSLGIFATPQEAHAAYCAAAVKLHGEFARVS